MLHTRKPLYHKSRPNSPKSLLRRQLTLECGLSSAPQSMHECLKFANAIMHGMGATATPQLMFNVRFTHWLKTAIKSKCSSLFSLYVFLNFITTFFFFFLISFFFFFFLFFFGSFSHLLSFIWSLVKASIVG